MDNRKVTLISIMTATGLAIQLSPRPPNVEFTSLIAFVTGMIFGSYTGAFVGALIMFVNGFLSPWGFGGLFIPFQMFGMAATGFFGGFYSKLNPDLRASYKTLKEAVGFHIKTAILGAFLTIIYRILMIVAVALISSTPIFITFIVSIPFTVIHIASNTIIFGFMCPSLYRIFHKLTYTWRSNS